MGSCKAGQELGLSNIISYTKARLKQLSTNDVFFMNNFIEVFVSQAYTAGQQSEKAKGDAEKVAMLDELWNFCGDGLMYPEDFQKFNNKIAEIRARLKS